MSRHLWVRRGCALLVAVVAAYASYEHQRRFALVGGADAVSAVLWPLSVDGLVVLASVGLLTTGPDASGRARWSVRLAFLLGVLVSLVANIAAAPVLAWQPIVVAGWPPVALLLSVELLALRPRQERTESVGASESGLRLVEDRESPTDQTVGEGRPAGEAESAPPGRRRRRRAEEVMWAHYQQELREGREPSGAELDRAAGTNNYGHAVLARWRRSGRVRVVAARPEPASVPGIR